MTRNERSGYGWESDEDEGGRRIILVREHGLALRIGTEGGTFSESDQVRTTRAGQVTRYEGTIPVEGQPTP